VVTLLAVMAGLIAVLALVPLAIIVFDAPASPPAMASMTEPSSKSEPVFPAPRQFKARDASTLQYYAWPAGSDRVAVLVHGSAFPATSMALLAEQLRSAGVTVYAPDIRGHGGSGRRGDIDYIGQLEDDLADFVAQVGLAKRGETSTLVGFSAGAGFTIRFAGGRYGELFDRYMFLAPILPGSPTLRPNAGGWTRVAGRRWAAIASLNGFGIHWFDGLPVVSYAVTSELARWVTASYSYRLASSFGAGARYESWLRGIRRPAAILVGSADEQEVADQFAPLMDRLGLDIPVTIVPNLKHADMTNHPDAAQAILRAMSSQGDAANEAVARVADK
jgi:alpha-beta hydrolase superfamily lysophospholipase